MVTTAKGVAHGLLEFCWWRSVHNCMKFGLTIGENRKDPGGQKKGGVIRKNTAPPHAVGFVLRSSVAPLRSRLSYTPAKISIVFGTAKFSAKKFAKRGKVSHVIGQKKGETSRFPPTRTYDKRHLRRPKQFVKVRQPRK